jgi:hypothetical protein
MLSIVRRTRPVAPQHASRASSITTPLSPLTSSCAAKVPVMPLPTMTTVGCRLEVAGCTVAQQPFGRVAMPVRVRAVERRRLGLPEGAAVTSLEQIAGHGGD